MKKIGNIKPPALSKFKQCLDDHCWNEKENRSIGEVYNYAMSENAAQAQFKQFFLLIQENRYKPIDSTPYKSLALTVCRGSVGEHYDPGFGLVALWLIRLSGFNPGRYSGWGEFPELYAGRKWGRVRLGDVIVFNASKKHAWLANSTSYMLMQTVAKKRVLR
jgi:hypothetical protein